MSSATSVYISNEVITQSKVSFLWQLRADFSQVHWKISGKCGKKGESVLVLHQVHWFYQMQYIFISGSYGTKRKSIFFLAITRKSWSNALESIASATSM